jgi:hypothetical protein
LGDRVAAIAGKAAYRERLNPVGARLAREDVSSGDNKLEAG